MHNVPSWEKDDHVYELSEPKLDKRREPCEKAHLEICLVVLLVKDFCLRRTAVNVQTIKGRTGDVAFLLVREASEVFLDFTSTHTHKMIVLQQLKLFLNIEYIHI